MAEQAGMLKKNRRYKFYSLFGGANWWIHPPGGPAELRVVTRGICHNSGPGCSSHRSGGKNLPPVSRAVRDSRNPTGGRPPRDLEKSDQPERKPVPQEALDSELGASVMAEQKPCSRIGNGGTYRATVNQYGAAVIRGEEQEIRKDERTNMEQNTISDIEAVIEERRRTIERLDRGAAAMRLHANTLLAETQMLVETGLLSVRPDEAQRRGRNESKSQPPA